MMLGPSLKSQYGKITKATKTEEFSQKLTKQTKGCRMPSQIQAESPFLTFVASVKYPPSLWSFRIVRTKSGRPARSDPDTESRCARDCIWTSNFTYCTVQDIVVISSAIIVVS
jgi:hypothetical protein